MSMIHRWRWALFTSKSGIGRMHEHKYASQVAARVWRIDMWTSSTARSSSSSGPARSVTEPHLHLPALKEVPFIPKKTKPLTSLRLTITKEKEVLRGVTEKLIRKTTKGSVGKIHRHYPGTASLRDMSSEGSVSSGGGSSWKIYASRRIIRWRWLCEEFEPKLAFIPGLKNAVADAHKQNTLIPKK